MSTTNSNLVATLNKLREIPDIDLSISLTDCLGMTYSGFKLVSLDEEKLIIKESDGQKIEGPFALNKLRAITLRINLECLNLKGIYV